ncbi:type-F conjugative transfer system secretin TraK [Acinetobacter baumannii]|nr:type-F conjugative transfer system secretin TraK [Acinetobacter baumannii]
MKILSKLAMIPLLIASLLASGIASATQHIDKAYLDSVTVTVSSTEQNALVVQNRKIANVVPSIADALDYQKDVDQGVLYFKIQPWYENRTISAFVTDDQGVRYKLVMRPTASLGAEEIILMPPKNGSGSGGTEKETQSFLQQIKELIYTMGDDADSQQDELAISGISRSSVNQDIPLWKEARMRFVSRYDGDELYGEHYQVTNVTGSNLILLEQEFYRKKVVAVSIEHLNLLPGQTTNVFVVREK